MKYVQVNISEMSEAMRQALAADAEAKDVSRNEAAVEVLCSAYGIDRGVPRRSSYRPIPENDGPITFELPKPLRDKLRVQAARKGATMAGLIRVALAEHYELPPEEPTRKPRSASAPR